MIILLFGTDAHHYIGNIFLFLFSKILKHLLQISKKNVSIVQYYRHNRKLTSFKLNHIELLVKKGFI